jgi:hypothetical protein
LGLRSRAALLRLLSRLVAFESPSPPIDTRGRLTCTLSVLVRILVEVLAASGTGSDGRPDSFNFSPSRVMEAHNFKSTGARAELRLRAFALRAAIGACIGERKAVLY